MSDRWNNPAEESNPHRTEERERVREELEARLDAWDGLSTLEQVMVTTSAF